MKFLWGTSTAAYQIEGDNKWSDWWYWAEKGKLPKAGKACNHWELYREDIELMAKLGYNAYRFSIEWGRIFPEENRVNEDALVRYREIIELLLKKGIEPMVTLHHFTLPTWFALKGGFLRDENLKYWEKYVEAVADILKGVKLVSTTNEPMELVIEGYLTGNWPPFIRDPKKAFQVEKNLINAHSIAYEMLSGKYKVGIVKSMPSIKFPDGRIAEEVENLQTFYFFDAIFGGTLKTPFGELRVLESDLDYIGINYYTLHIVSPDKDPVVSLYEYEFDGYGRTQMGWRIYPKGIYEAIVKASRYERPMYITENGIATEDENERIDFIRAHISWVKRAIEEGFDVRGYFYWSFIDNYEWDKGFEPKFGLVAYDPLTWRRIPKKSAFALRELGVSDYLA
ncbi:beta-glucosidase [Thermococcus litoralis DSM 5473]|uniref:Beta-glucosidase n=1 Tax=Thermococcus litoralis (strain ATCC 51850 / DSM 5473 / JCM 8560 / NS-C) TaxID=523849 RepID=H3ZMI1_THELN|nr:glycoside hydrolase family 1 protein [Thermococcus litoralis]EHR78862.1 beta-glucosidase [Thermococcus litoralis DSM 5473]